MIQIRKSGERGRTQIDWLDSYHTFSFDEYYDPKFHNFKTLRVINEDFVKPAAGFPPHSHRDMEIVTYILEGELEHKDSMGNGSVIRRGDVQRMSAGTGVQHSEFNASSEKPVHLLQIWILPEKKGIEPGYEQKNFPDKDKKNRLKLLASRGGREGSVTIHQDAEVYGAILESGKTLDYELKPGRAAWLQVVSGEVGVNGKKLHPGDAASLMEETKISLKAAKLAEVLLFDLA